MTFMVFGLWQLYDLEFSGDWSIANLAVACFCVLLCLGVLLWVICLSVSYRRNFDNVPKKHAFILGDESSIPYQIPLRYIRKLIVCLFLFTGMIELQVVGMLAGNFLILSFYVIYKPSKSKFSNYINILIELCYMGL